MIDVVVLGQPYWASRIARALRSADGEMRAAFVPQARYPRLLARPPRAGRVVLLRAGYRTGATTPRGRLFDAYWAVLCRRLPRALRCHYWLGTDVLDTVEEARAGTLRAAALAATRDDLHLADAPWLAEELATLDIEAATAHVPQATRAPATVPPLPPEFAVMTYLAAGRFDFYGGGTILEVARRLPDARFDVVGSHPEAGSSPPPNVRWHGWVDDMPERYPATTVVVRIPRHDGLGQTVVEGLLNARHVVYTHELPHVRTVSPATPDTLFAALGELREAHAAGRLEPNVAGREFALEEYDEARLADRLVTLVRGRA